MMMCRSIFSISSHINWPSTRLRDNVPWCERDMCSAFRRNNPPPVIGLFSLFHRRYNIYLILRYSMIIYMYYFVIKTCLHFQNEYLCSGRGQKNILYSTKRDYYCLSYDNDNVFSNTLFLFLFVLLSPPSYN